jgi:hypothetical protein
LCDRNETLPLSPRLLQYEHSLSPSGSGLPHFPQYSVAFSQNLHTVSPAAKGLPHFPQKRGIGVYLLFVASRCASVAPKGAVVLHILQVLQESGLSHPQVLHFHMLICSFFVLLTHYKGLPLKPTRFL